MILFCWCAVKKGVILRGKLRVVVDSTTAVTLSPYAIVSFLLSLSTSSLSQLSQVIRATAMGKQHAPFRQSRLTQVLQECFVGKACQTTVVGCVSPSESDLQETINTLRQVGCSMANVRRSFCRVLSGFNCTRRSYNFRTASSWCIFYTPPLP